MGRVGSRTGSAAAAKATKETCSLRIVPGLHGDMEQLASVDSALKEGRGVRLRHRPRLKRVMLLVLRFALGDMRVS